MLRLCPVHQIARAPVTVAEPGRTQLRYEYACPLCQREKAESRGRRPPQGAARRPAGR